MLGIEDRCEGDRHTLLLVGELDLATVRRLEQQAARLLREHAGELVLDLSGLEFIDSAGLNAILSVKALCQEHACDFGLTPGAKPVQRLFEITRLTDRLPSPQSRGEHEREPASPEAETSPELGRPEPEPER